ncbi:MAG: DUF1244 domain-containing protein [Alphaproteobacteria bacterium]|nr:DUF1244 domain-containing protein [Alphaproteobacteria bacterium]
MDEMTRLKIEAAAFRGLVKHLQKRTDAQNIDIMNTAGFCRNCLAKWYKAASEHYGAAVTIETAQEAVYGMPQKEWKAKYQKESSADQQKKFEDTKPLHAAISVVE